MDTKLISIAKDFSPHPAGRYMTDGPYSGQRFREDLLYPALRDNDRVDIDMDGALGYGSSFLEEAFGGLIREHDMTAQALRSKMTLRCSVRLYVDRAWQYIDEEDGRRKR